MHSISPAKAAIPRTPASHEPSTPSTVLSMASTAFSTPSTASSISSTAKSLTSQAMSPQRLRHPSRLHSRDLNGNTFRIYVKHYMDRISISQPIPSGYDDSDYESDANALPEFPATPTKRKHAAAACDETPRPGPSTATASTRTPRPRIQRLSFGGPLSPQSRSTSDASTFTHEDPTMAGFTLSYLRRAPELADMAKRVVKAVAKRRLREERKEAKEAAAAFPPPAQPSKSQSQAEHAANFGPRVKRLFQSTVVQLLREGSIVLWDGPVRSLLPSLNLPEGQGQITVNTGLWKANVTSVSADNTVFSSIGRKSFEEDEEALELSDPEEGEEAYVPVSPQFLAVVVEGAIGKLAKVGGSHGGASKGRGARSGATTEGISAYLRKDDRWRYLNEWNVVEALDVLKIEGKVRSSGKERWELIL
ncbi:hypothetical protein DXG03_002744 [Asterophora parasitica]|uniref:Uncharacterized protein n=1 Tax=Asterophora parasitica TaxID=117018 RepID=A0A9P7KC34_9AGAR|nr:hypothetical protein DXG03_002744 [Asterophora parasitica]